MKYTLLVMYIIDSDKYVSISIGSLTLRNVGIITFL